MKLNFMGDLVIQNPENIRIGENLKDCLDKSNYNIVNFEAPIREEKGISELKSGPNICQSADNQSWLSQNNFQILAMANNHIMDYGTQGLENTLSCLKNCKHIGVGNWEEAYSPLIIEEGNLKVALFSMAELQFGILQDDDNRDKQGCAWINHFSVNEIIRHTKKEVDFVVMIAHAGLEGIELPLPEWRCRYRELIDAGCDVIIGGHTHTAQGYEVYKGKPIFYSLGNFCFEKDKPAKDTKWNIGEVVSIEFTKTTLSFVVSGTTFQNNTIELMDKATWGTYLHQLNEKLSVNYMDQINQICNRMMDGYNNLFSMGGYIHIDRMLIKSILRYLLGRCNSLHALNNLQCESHRWTICRAIRNQKGLI